MKEDSRKTKDRRIIVELKDRAMNKILLLYVKKENKSIAFDIRSSGEERGSFCLSPMVGWLSLDQDLLGLWLWFDVIKKIN